MKRNMGGFDRAIRFALGIGLWSIGYFGPFPTWGAIAAYIVGGVLVLTGTLGFCPLYQVLGIDTCAHEMKQRFS